MKMYVWLSFAVMGWAYYEISGGSDFVPQQAPTVAEAETTANENQIARANSPEILIAPAPSVSTLEPIEAPVEVQVEQVAEAEPTPIPTEATPAQAELEPTSVELEPVTERVAFTAERPPAPVEDTTFTAPPLDIRQVAGSRVNMRVGPSTDFDVIITLDDGTEMEVLEVNADGWANVIIVDSGVEGWMAERLLRDPQG